MVCSFGYGFGDGVVLEDILFVVELGEIFVVVGFLGMGKMMFF